MIQILDENPEKLSDDISALIRSRSFLLMWKL
jgi:hypothetical protein